MKWRADESLKDPAWLSEKASGQRREVFLKKWQTARNGKRDPGWGFCRWKEGWAGQGGTACVSLPLCPCMPPALGRSTAEPWHTNPGPVLSIQLLPCAPERVWASNSRASPTPAGQVLYSAVSQERGRKAGEGKARKKSKGAIKIIIASLPVVMQSLIFTNEEKQPQHLSKYLNLPQCFFCVIKKK